METLIRTGEVIRTQKDLEIIDADRSISEMIVVNRLDTLVKVTTFYKGMVGEGIECYTYFLISFSSGKPEIIPIKDYDQFKNKVYATATSKKNRIRLWGIMKSEHFHGWSEDPRPYVI